MTRWLEFLRATVELVVDEDGAFGQQELLHLVAHGREIPVEVVRNGVNSLAGAVAEGLVEDYAGRMEPLEPDPVIDAYKPGIDRSLLRANLKRTPEERLLNLMALQRDLEALREAGRRSRDGSRSGGRTGR